MIVLSARGREGDKVTALDAGAEDDLTKPFAAAMRWPPGTAALLAQANRALSEETSSHRGRTSVVDVVLQAATDREISSRRTH